MAAPSLDVTEDLMLPPAALQLDGFGPLPADAWKHVAFLLDAPALCGVACASRGCERQPRAVEAEIWARLCSEHFPSMYRSVLEEPRGGRGGGGGGGQPEGKSSRKGRGSCRQRGGTGDGTALDEAAVDDVLEPVPGAGGYGGAGLEPSGVSPAYSYVSSPLWAASSAASTAATPSLAPAERLTPPPEFELPPAPAYAHDWRSLYARRWRKRAEWEAAKRRDGGRERGLSGLSDPAEASTGGGEPLAAARRISELSKRELGCLTDSTHRLKVCSRCGEKYSPSEARKEQLSCCFHPGTFEPVDTGGWSRSELKQLQQYTRQALKSAGGASWVQRHPRASRGHGHWLKGLGVLANGKGKFLCCLEGRAAVSWSCCGAGELFAEGCKRAMHRP